jgi:hypothetical protein
MPVIEGKAYRPPSCFEIVEQGGAVCTVERPIIPDESRESGEMVCSVWLTPDSHYPQTLNGPDFVRFEPIVGGWAVWDSFDLCKPKFKTLPEAVRAWKDNPKMKVCSHAEKLRRMRTDRPESVWATM